MNTRLTTTKVFLSALVFALISAILFIRLFGYLFPSQYGGGFDIGDITNNPYIGTFFGFFFSFPFMLGLLGMLWFDNNLIKIIRFILIPLTLINLLWLFIDKEALILFYLGGILLSIIGYSLGYLVMFSRKALYK